MVQKNLRFNLRNINHDVFDLKGVGKQRRMDTGGVSTAEDNEDLGSPRAPRPGPVFWDQNFREWTQGKPLCLGKEDLHYLEAAMCFVLRVWCSNLEVPGDIPGLLIWYVV